MIEGGLHMNVLFHVNELDKWPQAVVNVRNMIAHGEQENIIFHIEIVANGEAVKQLRCDLEETDALAGDLKALQARGVKIVACANSLWNSGVHEEALLAFVDVVPSGVVEIAMRQQYGFAYIKP